MTKFTYADSPAPPTSLSGVQESGLPLQIFAVIDARSSDLGKGHWEYKLDMISPAYEKRYLDRRKKDSKENPSVIGSLEKRVKELEGLLAQAPKPVMDSDLSMGEWDDAYEVWYAKATQADLI